MNDQEIRNILTSYAESEMNLLCEEDLPGCDHVYSKRYQKKIKRLFRMERYFGEKLRLGYALQRIAVAAIIVLSLCVANQVSAEVFGFNPWKYVTSFLHDSKMDEKTYIEPEDQTDDTVVAAMTKDIPEQIPEGFEQVACERNDRGLYVEWRKGDGGYLQYSRETLSIGLKVAVDGEYESREKIEVVGFTGDYYVKGQEAWVIWDDVSYNQLIVVTGVKDPKNILISMAESLYQ